MMGAVEHIPVLQEDDKPMIVAAYRKLLKSFSSTLNKEDERNVRAAFEMAAEAHVQQRRKTGEPYILHPIEVARICVEEIGLGPTAVVCALLHDVVEDTDVTLKEVNDRFGDRVALIVDGLTKLDSLHDSESPQADNLAKVLRAMVSDVRVVLIKMADRLHNLRTIKSMPRTKQFKIAAETTSIYAPLAHRLGLYAIKSEFQDLCLKITHPEEYHQIADQLAETKRSREQYVREFIKPIQRELETLGYPFRIIGRPKSIYSIWNKVRTKGVEFKDIYDLFAVRIIIDVPHTQERNVCWMAYTTVTDLYKPISDRLKDWIATPKPNGYESLHTTVVGQDGRYVEVQIRSERMDEIAERGFAAHWKYKGIRNAGVNVYDDWLNQIREILEHTEGGSAVEFLADFHSNLYSDGVHVYTPKGEMRILPDGATALDFAFSIHSDVGAACRAVKINNRLVPISYVLKNGDQVEVITDRNQRPTEDWLKIVVTSKARNRIRQSLRDERRTQAEFGREALARKLNGLRVSLEENVDMLARWFGFPNRLEFLSAIYREQVDLTVINKHFRADGLLLVEIDVPKPPNAGPTALPVISPRPADKIQKAEVIINGEPGHFYPYTFATCCNPVQGDTIFAYNSQKEGFKIHRLTCPNAENLLSHYAHRVMPAEWGQTAKYNFVATIMVTGIDIGPGAIQRLTDRLANLGVNIRSFSISGDDGYFEGRIAFVVNHADQIAIVIRNLKELDWVSNVSRVE
ncbi:MAG: RelA/SpoT family protein [Saprospiraceae bacterium]|nr:RelA/SpoT family protein [Saprospiraceae bacterium]